MFDSRKQNPNCNFAEEIVSYIYDEMKSKEKAVFETHLAKCSSCADNIAAFSNVSFSIKEWRDEEFASLETPEIEIPYDTANVPVSLVHTVETKKSWLDNLGDLFNFSPGIFKTATALGALTIVIGLGWFMLNSSYNKNDKVAENDTKEKQQKVSEPSRAIAVGEQEKAVVIQTYEDKGESTDQNSDRSKVTAVNKPKPVSDETRVVKVRKPPVRKAINKTKRKRVKSNPKKKDSNLKPNKQENNEIQEIPKLTEFAIEDTEDDELRLTDLFEEDESGD